MPLPPVPRFAPRADPRAVVCCGPARFTVLDDRLLRLEFDPRGCFEDRPSQVFWHRLQPVPAFEQRREGGGLVIETGSLSLQYRPSARGFSRRSLSIRLKEAGRTWRYGDSPRRAGNLKGTARTLDGAAGPVRLENGLLSRAGWAVVDDSRTLVFDEKGWLTPRSAGGQDLYFFGFGTDARACLQAFTRLAGAVPLIPRYVLGNWWSRYWAYSQAELQELVEDFQRHEIPLAVCVVDMDWHITKTGNESSGWTGTTWNRELFPDPAGFLRWLHARGLRTALNLHPAGGVHPHEEQYPAMARWMGRDPANRQPVPFDISDPHFMEGYFELLHHPLEALGVDFWWLDWQQGRRSRMAGLDPLRALNHLHFQDLGREGLKRPFIFSRWGGLGNHRTPIGFSGDTFIGWRSLRFQPYFTATAANVAYGWWSHDIGGHMFREGSPELYLRWVQFGVFSPIMRLHATKKAELDRRPWKKPDRVFRATRAALQLRHALIPYLYSMAWRYHRTGLAPIVPMYYGDPAEKAAYRAADQYWFGSQLVAAPILRPGSRAAGRAARKVWLPPGQWTGFFTGRTYAGGAWIRVQAGLEDIPVFARPGAIVPLAGPDGRGGLDNPDLLDVYLFPGADGTFELYEDDGLTTRYQQGAHAVTRMDLVRQPGCLTFRLHPVEGDRSLLPAVRRYTLHLRGVPAGARCRLPGSYDPQLRTLSLEPVQIDPGRRKIWQVVFELPDQAG